MPSSIDLTNLRDITDGDVEFEQKLLAMFIDNSSECLSNLKKFCDKDENDMWHRQAHSLKGLALNIGAKKLAEFCLAAEKSPSKSSLILVEKEYKKVKSEIEKLIKK